EAGIDPARVAESFDPSECVCNESACDLEQQGLVLLRYVHSDHPGRVDPGLDESPFHLHLVVTARKDLRAVEAESDVLARVSQNSLGRDFVEVLGDEPGIDPQAVLFRRLAHDGTLLRATPSYPRPRVPASAGKR